MANIYLAHAVVNYAAAQNYREPRKRFTEYYSDLYQLNNKSVDHITYLQGDQLDYVSLGRAVLDPCYIDGWLADTDMLICTMWAHEFDPNYSSSGPYFSERYKIPSVFDVCEQGTITPFLGLKILSKYMESKRVSKVSMLGLEQTSIPRKFADNAVMPSLSGAGAIIFSREPVRERKYNFLLIAADIINEEAVLRYSFDVSEIIRLVCNEININLAELSIILKKSSTLWKSYCKYKYEKSVIPLHEPMNFLKNQIGILPFFSCLESLLKQENEFSRYIAIIDEDVESLSVGFAIFEVVNNEN